MDEAETPHLALRRWHWEGESLSCEHLGVLLRKFSHLGICFWDVLPGGVGKERQDFSNSQLLESSLCSSLCSYPRAVLRNTFNRRLFLWYNQFASVELQGLSKRKNALFPFLGQRVKMEAPLSSGKIIRKPHHCPYGDSCPEKRPCQLWTMWGLQENSRYSPVLMA